MITCNELIDRLIALRAEGYGEVEVKIAYQPNYPMEERVTDVVGFNGHTTDDTEEKDKEAAIYLTGSSRNDYAPHRIFESTNCDDVLDDEDYVEDMSDYDESQDEDADT